METIDRQAALDVTRETVFVEYEDDDQRKEESIILQTKAAIRDRIKALSPTPAIPVEWIEKYMSSLKRGIYVGPAWAIKMMLKAWQDEQEVEHG